MHLLKDQHKVLIDMEKVCLKRYLEMLGDKKVLVEYIETCIMESKPT